VPVDCGISRSWYDGNTTDKSDIWLARIGIV